MTRFALIALMLTSLTACMPQFEKEAQEVKLTFDYVPTSQATLNYADLMCCYDCAV